MSEQPTLPSVGDGATMYHWSDRTAWTVVAVGGTAKRPVVTIKRDQATLLSGDITRYPQRYEFAPCPTGQVLEVRYTTRKGQGAWRAGDTPVVFGERREYYDPSF